MITNYRVNNNICYKYVIDLQSNKITETYIVIIIEYNNLGIIDMYKLNENKDYVKEYSK